MKPIFLPLVLAGSLFFSGSEAAESRLQDSIGGSRSNTFALSAGFGPAMLDGEVGWGIGAGIAQELQVGNPFYMGLDLGFHVWNRSNQSDPLKTLVQKVATGNVTNIQILPTFCYQFLLPMAPGAIPYLGLSVGPSLYFSSGTTSAGEEIRESQIYPVVLIRPGLHLVVSDDTGITLEPKMGILKSEFLFVPQANVVWLL